MVSVNRIRGVWSPWAELEQIRNEFNRAISGASATASPRGEFPPVAVWQGDNGWALTFEVPGFEIEDFDITITKDLLTLSGPVASGISEDQSPVRRERFSEAFTRKLKLPFEVDAQKSEATYDKGVLTITLQRPAEHQPTKVAVKAG